MADPKTSKKTASQTPPLLDYEWQVDGRPDGKRRKVGEQISMTEAQAKYHLQAGALKRSSSATEPEKKTAQSTVKAASKATTAK